MDTLPEEIVQKILLYNSHPVADIIRNLDLSYEMSCYAQLSYCRHCGIFMGESCGSDCYGECEAKMTAYDGRGLLCLRLSHCC